MRADVPRGQEPSEPGPARGPVSRAVEVLIVDDHLLFGQALQSTLAAEISVIGVVQTAGEALDVMRFRRPDVVLVDLMLAVEDGISVGQRILKEHPDTAVVALSALRHPNVVREALRAGFRGYLTKDIPLSRFVSSIQAIVGGELVIPRELPRRAVRDGASDDPEAALLAQHLTPREHRVLCLLVDGMSGREISKHLGVRPNTVRTHIQNVLAKLGVHSRLEAVAFAVRHGLVDDRLERRRA